MPDQDRTVEVGIGFKATDKTGVDLIKQTAESLDRARVSLEAANKVGGLKKVVAAQQLQEVNALTEASAKTAQEILDVQAALESLGATDPGFDEKTAQLAALNKQLQELNAEAARVPARLGIVDTTNPGNAKQGITGKEAASQVIGGAGGLAAQVSPGAGQAAMILQQALQVGDGFKKLSSILVETPGIIGAVSTAAATAAAPLGATAAGLAAVTVVLLPVILAIAGLALVVTHLNDKAKEGEVAAQKYIDALDGQIKVDREIADFMKSGDLEGAKKRYQDLLKAQEDSNAQLTYLYQQKADIDRKYSDAQKNLNLDQLASLGSEGGKIKDEIDKVYKDQFLPAKQAVDEFGKSMDGITEAAGDKAKLDAQIKAITDRTAVETELAGLISKGNSGAISDRRKAIQDEIDSIQDELPRLKALGTGHEEVAAAVKLAEQRSGELKNQLDLYTPSAIAAADAQAQLNKSNQDLLASYTQQIQSTQQIAGFLKSANTEQLDDRVDSLNTERDAILSQLASIKELGKTNTEAAQKAKDYESRLKAINGEYSALNAARPDVRAKEITKAQNEMLAAEVATDRKIADIRKSGLAKLADIETQKTEADTAAYDKRKDAIGKANTGQTKAVNEVDAAYMKDEIESWKKFRDDVSKEEARNKKERLRSIDETNAALLQAEKSNDVVAFIAAAEKGRDQLKQIDESAKDAADERQTAFFAEREQAKAQHDDRINEIKAQGDEARANAQKQFDLDIAANKKNHDEALKAQQEQQEQLIAAEEAGLLQRLSAIQNTYHLEDSMLQDIFDKRKARYGEDDKIINERLDLELQRHAEDLKAKANAEIAENARTIKTKADAEGKVAAAVASVIGQNFGQAVTVIQTGLTSFINYIRAQLAASSGGSGSKPPSSGSGSGGSGFGYKATAFANEGIITAATGKTFAMLGENLTPGQIEAVVKFRPSEGLPPSLTGGTGGGNGLTINLNGDIDLGGITAEQFNEGLHTLGMEIIQGTRDARRPTG